MKYTPQQLKEMAIALLQAQAQGDPRFIQFLVMMHAMTGMAPDLIQNRIQEFAAYKEPSNEHG